MKTRTCFVSNSSSSSFVCGVCKHSEAGMDMSIEEANMIQCEQGHTVCKDHLDADIIAPRKEAKLKICIADIKTSSMFLTDAKQAEEIKKISEDEEYLDDYYDDITLDSGFSSEHCPICQFNSLYAPDAFIYLMNKAGLTKQVLAQQLKNEFTTYKEFTKSLNRKL